jgi:flagellar biosynthesis protein FliQ
LELGGAALTSVLAIVVPALAAFLVVGLIFIVFRKLLSKTRTVQTAPLLQTGLS